MRIHRIIMLSVLIQLLMSPAWAMERYVNTVQDRQGNAIPGTQITVYIAGTDVLADLFVDNGVTPKDNPFINYANGSFDFFAANGVYDFHFVRSGTDFSTLNTIFKRIGIFDVNDSGIAGGGLNWPTNLVPSAATSEDIPIKVRGLGPQVNSGWNIYMHSNGTPTIRCVINDIEGDCNIQVTIYDSRYWALYDKDANLIMKIEPGASGMKNKFVFGDLYRPVRTVYFDAGGINVDGTNCTVPTETSLNSSEKTWVIACADSNSSKLSGKYRMRPAWDGGTVLFTLSLFHGTSESITFAGDFSARCRGAGDTIDSTYGTAVQADVAITTANQIAEATTAAVTPNGACAGGKFLSWRYVVDAANFSANAANAKVLGVTMQYSVTSLSD